MTLTHTFFAAASTLLSSPASPREDAAAVPTGSVRLWRRSLPLLPLVVGLGTVLFLDRLGGGADHGRERQRPGRAEEPPAMVARIPRGAVVRVDQRAQEQPLVNRQ